jgi:hypothetical protein
MWKNRSSFVGFDGTLTEMVRFEPWSPWRMNVEDGFAARALERNAVQSQSASCLGDEILGRHRGVRSLNDRRLTSQEQEARERQPKARAIHLHENARKYRNPEEKQQNGENKQRDEETGSPDFP